MARKKTYQERHIQREKEKVYQHFLDHRGAWRKLCWKLYDRGWNYGDEARNHTARRELLEAIWLLRSVRQYNKKLTSRVSAAIDTVSHYAALAKYPTPEPTND